MKYYIIDDNVDFIITKNRTVSYKKHNHSSTYVAGIVLKGRVNLQTISGEKVYQENEFFVISPYMVHAIDIKDDTTCMLTMCIKEEFLEKYQELGLLQIQRQLEKLKEIESLEEEHIKAVHRAYVSILQYYNKELLSFPKEIEGIKDKLIAYPQNDLEIEYMAETAFLNKYYFIRKFNKNVGMTPHKFQIQNRVRKSQKLLQQGKTVVEVAVAMGFYDQSHFIKTFRQIVGLTPHEYVNSVLFID